jgi:hypothetical protein
MITEDLSGVRGGMGRKKQKRTMTDSKSEN